MKNRFSRWIENRTRNDPRISTCNRCGGGWNWKEGHTVYYTTSHHSGMFPICEDCWKEITPEERFHYCHELSMRWAMSGHPKLNIDWGVVREECGMKKDE
jgi:hypothetical protein